MIMDKITFKTHFLKIREENGAYYTMTPYAKVIKLNETSYQMLKLCENIKDSKALSKAVARRFSLEENRAIEETKYFLDGMLKCGLIELSV